MFYDKLLELALANGYKSPTAAAEAVGMTGAHISKWKRGSEPTDATKLKFAKLFNVSPSVFDETENELETYLEDLRSRPETRALLEASRGMTKEEVEAMAAFAMKLKGET